MNVWKASTAMLDLPPEDKIPAQLASSEQSGKAHKLLTVVFVQQASSALP
jgi:hypothetical protein